MLALQTTPPKISLLSPTNQVYNASSVPLVFSVNVLSLVKNVSWDGYSLDGKSNATITGNSSSTNNLVTNFTLTNMTNGFHSLTIYANDTYGNTGASQTINFTIAIPKAESFPTATVAAVSGVAIVVVVVAGLLVYFGRRKRVRLQ